jgi:hypothetical protein
MRGLRTRESGMRIAGLAVAAWAGLAGTAGAQTWEAVRETDRISGEVRVAGVRGWSTDGQMRLLFQCRPRPGTSVGDFTLWATHARRRTVGTPTERARVRWRIEPGGEVGASDWPIAFDDDSAFLMSWDGRTLASRLARGMTAVIELPRAAGRPVQAEFDLRGLTAQLRTLRPFGCEIPSP